MTTRRTASAGAAARSDAPAPPPSQPPLRRPALHEAPPPLTSRRDIEQSTYTANRSKQLREGNRAS
jgi:hypothetical protein